MNKYFVSSLVELTYHYASDMMTRLADGFLKMYTFTR